MTKPFTGGRPLGNGIADAVLADIELADQLATYRRRVAGNYHPLPPDEIAKLPNGQMWVSEKVDGGLWFLVSQGGETFLANPQGSVIAGDIPVISQAGKLSDGTIIAGELHAKVEGRRARVGDLAAAMGGGASAKTETIAFTAFDLVQEAGSAELGGYTDRLSKIQTLINPSENLSVIATEAPTTASEVKALFEARVASGEAEGLVVRLETGLIYKLKPEVKLKMAIVAYTVKADQPEMVRSILLSLIKDDGSHQILGGCGNLGSEDDRKSLLTKLQALKAESTARYASDGGGLYTFVKPELVAAVTVTDLQSLLSDGSPANGMLVQYSKGGWSSFGMHPAPKLIHPVMTGVVSGAKADQGTAGYDQVADYLPPAKKDQVSGKLPESTVIRRDVWTKTAKGATAVRKLLVWKTNKEQADPSYPAYVVHWTDYSAGRATPLDRDIRLAPDEKSALSIAEELISENIKKGWEKMT
jgi:hypothetical protein